VAQLAVEQDNKADPKERTLRIPVEVLVAERPTTRAFFQARAAVPPGDSKVSPEELRVRKADRLARAAELQEPMEAAPIAAAVRDLQGVRLEVPERIPVRAAAKRVETAAVLADIRTLVVRRAVVKTDPLGSRAAAMAAAR